MNKYEKAFKQTQEKMHSRNNFLLSIIMLKLRSINVEPNIDSIIVNYSSFSDSDKSILRKDLISRLSKGFLYKLLLFYSSNAIYYDDRALLNKVFNSYKDLGLISEGRILPGNRKSLEIILGTGEKIYYSPIIFLSSEETSLLNGMCHETTSAFMKEDVNENNEIGVVLEPYLFGGQVYHSFMIVNDIVYDYSHNIVIRYDDYIKLVGPEVLVREKCRMAKNSIIDLNILNDEFLTCDYVDVLKYGIERQLQMRDPYGKKYTRKV